MGILWIKPFRVKPSALQDDWLPCEDTQGKIQSKIPLSPCVDNVSLVERNVNSLVVIVDEAVATVVVIGSPVRQKRQKEM